MTQNHLCKATIRKSLLGGIQQGRAHSLPTMSLYHVEFGDLPASTRWWVALGASIPWLVRWACDDIPGRLPIQLRDVDE